MGDKKEIFPTRLEGFFVAQRGNTKAQKNFFFSRGIDLEEHLHFS